jgi:hypothetical protein
MMRRWIGSALRYGALVVVLVGCSKTNLAPTGQDRTSAYAVPAHSRAAPQRREGAHEGRAGIRLASNEGSFPWPEWVDQEHVLVRHYLVRTHDEDAYEPWIYEVKTGRVTKLRGKAGATLALGWGLLRHAGPGNCVEAALTCNARVWLRNRPRPVRLDKMTLDQRSCVLAGLAVDSSGATIVICDVAAGSALTVPIPRGTRVDDLCLAYPSAASRDGKRVAFWVRGSPPSDRLAVFICDVVGGKVVWTGSVRPIGVEGVFWAADGLLVPPLANPTDTRTAVWHVLDPISLKVSDLSLPGGIESVAPAGDWVALRGAQGRLLFNRKTHTTVRLTGSPERVEWSPRGDRVVWSVGVHPQPPDGGGPAELYWLDLSAYTKGDRGASEG